PKKSQVSSSKPRPALRAWSFGLLWSLELGVWDLVFLWSLEFGIWSLLPGPSASQELRCPSPARELISALSPRVGALKYQHGDTRGTNRSARGACSGPGGAPAGTGRPALPRRIRAALRAHAERQEGRADRRN